MNYNDIKNNIHNFSIEDLKNILIDYNQGIISEQKYESIKLVLYELEYRRLSTYINNGVDLKVLMNYNYDIVWKISNDEINNSIKFLKKNKVPFDGFLRWIPICLDMNLVYSIYNKLKGEGKSNEDIFKILVSDIRINLDSYIKSNDNKYTKDNDFISFITEVFNSLNDKRKETDVYKRMMDEIMEENQEVLKKLK